MPQKRVIRHIGQHSRQTFSIQKSTRDLSPGHGDKVVADEDPHNGQVGQKSLFPVLSFQALEHGRGSLALKETGPLWVLPSELSTMAQLSRDDA